MTFCYCTLIGYGDYFALVSSLSQYPISTEVTRRRTIVFVERERGQGDENHIHLNLISRSRTRHVVCSPPYFIRVTPSRRGVDICTFYLRHKRVSQ